MNVVAVLLGGGQHVKRSTVAVDYWCAGNADLRVDRRVQIGGWNRRHALGRVEETDGPQSRTGLIIGVEGVDGVVLRRDVDHIVVLSVYWDLIDIKRLGEDLPVERVREQFAKISTELRWLVTGRFR